MTKKRFIKLVLFCHIQRNEAFALTLEVSKAGSYKRLFLWFLIRRFPIVFYNPRFQRIRTQFAMRAIKSEATAQKRNPTFDIFAEELYTIHFRKNDTADIITRNLNCISEIIRKKTPTIRKSFSSIADFITKIHESYLISQTIAKTAYTPFTFSTTSSKHPTTEGEFIKNAT